jgi:hypothetical protein
LFLNLRFNFVYFHMLVMQTSHALPTLAWLHSQLNRTQRRLDQVVAERDEALQMCEAFARGSASNKENSHHNRNPSDSLTTSLPELTALVGGLRVELNQLMSARTADRDSLKRIRGERARLRHQLHTANREHQQEKAQWQAQLHAQQEIASKAQLECEQWRARALAAEHQAVQRAVQSTLPVTITESNPNHDKHSSIAAVAAAHDTDDIDSIVPSAFASRASRSAAVATRSVVDSRAPERWFMHAIAESPVTTIETVRTPAPVSVPKFTPDPHTRASPPAASPTGSISKIPRPRHIARALSTTSLNTSESSSSSLESLSDLVDATVVTSRATLARRPPPSI